MRQPMRLTGGTIVGLLVSLCSATTIAQASTSLAPKLSPQNLASLQDQSQERSHSMAKDSPSRVTIVVKDSTIEYAIHEVARQGGLRVVYNNRYPVLAKRVTLNFVKKPIMDAYASILKGTGLIATLVAESETIVIRPQRDSLEQKKPADSVGTVRGRVLDSTTGKPLPHVVVAVQGTTLSTLTNDLGIYTIPDIPSGPRTLAFRLLGYRTLTRSVSVDPDHPAVMNITLIPTAAALSEVVTTATGMQRRVEVPSDIVRIDAEKIMERAPVQRFTDLIEAAQVPGVIVTRASGDPGSASKIRIRGLRSMTQSNDPVVIVDGNWINASVGTPSGFDDIDPATIETVEIVRGPSASTLYGQDAANGVIVITTKKGHAGLTRWRTEYQRNWGQTYGTVPLSYAGLGTVPSNGSRVWCPITQVLAGNCIQDSVAVYNPNDPLLDAEGGQMTHRFIVGVDGGTPAAMYSLTATATKTIGARQIRPIDAIRYRLLDIPVERKFKRPRTEDARTLNTGLTLNPMPSITLGVTLSGSQRDLPNNSITAVEYSGLNSGGVSQEYSLDTVQLWYLPGSSIPASSRIAKQTSSTRRSSILLGGNMDWRAFGWFAHANAGISRSEDDGTIFTQNIDCKAVVCHDTIGGRTESSGRETQLTGRFNVSKQLNLGWLSRVLDLQPSFGGDFRKTETAQAGMRVDSIPVGETSIAVGGTPRVSSNSIESAVAGWYANVRVGILQRLYFDLGSRQDVGSALKSAVGGVQYPKLGGSYLISDEPFWPRNSLISMLRLRSAVGYSAIQPDILDIRGRYMGRAVFAAGQLASGLRLAGPGNSALKPERVMELEVGFDADVFGDRLNIVANYAHSENRNAMIIRELPPSAGGLTSGKRKENVGRVRNRNVEVTSELKLIDSRMVRMLFSHTLTLQENVVAELGDKVTPFSGTAVGQIREGYPIGGVWVNRILGWRDKNGDGILARDEVVLDDSLVYAGWSQPRYSAGYGINFTIFGRLTFDTRVSQSSRYVVSYDPGSENRYGQEAVTAPLPVQASEVASAVNNKRSISVLRWNSASVMWFLPQRTLRAMKMREVSIGLKASNLALWSNYSGRDPGVDSDINTEALTDNGGVLPQPRLFELNLRIGL